MNTYFWELRPDDIRWLGMSIFFSLIALGIAGPLQLHFEKRDIAIVCLIFLIVTLMLKVFFRFADVWPDNGDSKLLPLLILFTSAQMFLATLFAVMVVAMLPDMVDEQQWSVGRRQEGVFASAFSFASKTTAGIGLLLGGLLLEYVIAFPTQAEPGEISPNTLLALGVVDGLIVPCFFFIPVYMLRRYSLSRNRLAEIQSQLASR
jgi:Na+/melibiose symporter-like transporter